MHGELIIESQQLPWQPKNVIVGTFDDQKWNIAFGMPQLQQPLLFGRFEDGRQFFPNVGGDDLEPLLLPGIGLGRPRQRSKLMNPAAAVFVDGVANFARCFAVWKDVPEQGQLPQICRRRRRFQPANHCRQRHAFVRRDRIRLLPIVFQQRQGLCGGVHKDVEDAVTVSNNNALLGPVVQVGLADGSGQDLKWSGSCGRVRISGSGVLSGWQRCHELTAFGKTTGGIQPQIIRGICGMVNRIRDCFFAEVKKVRPEWFRCGVAADVNRPQP